MAIDVEIGRLFSPAVGEVDVDQAALLADAIQGELRDAELGHCARVDFLSREEALVVCQALDERLAGDVRAFTVRVLASRAGEAGSYITTDEAIEIRNRKQSRLCLFVPSDTVDAAYSSLANSFAPLDARALYATALRRVLDRLPDEARRIVRDVRTALRPPLQAGDDHLLDFVVALLTLSARDSLDTSGRELWRVGLIADAGPDFTARLGDNRRATLKLARPAKLTATPRERIATLGVDAEATDRLLSFFARHVVYDTRTWSRALANGEGPTFDQWVFPRQDRSDVRSVTIRPFVNSEGVVERYCKLQQPDGPRGTLQAVCGPKGAMVVRWDTDPPQPDNLAHWLVEIAPSDDGDENDESVELLSREIPGSRRSVTLKLDLDVEDLPADFMRVRVTALDGAGRPIVAQESGDAVAAVSDEFLLSDAPISGSAPSTSRRTVPTIAYGRLETALDARQAELAETQPQWASKDLEYFSLRLNERRLLNIGLSKTLLALERRALAEPRAGGCFVLDSDEVGPAEARSVRGTALASVDDAWEPFFRQRELLFARLRKNESRNVVEAADWGGELSGAALRYAQAYRDLLDALTKQGAPRDAVLQALSVDTLLVRIADGAAGREEAIVVLPTHPLRVAWTVGYTQLLHSWETAILGQSLASRRQAVDMRALPSVTPTNVPPFAYHPEARESGPFVFFHNLRFFHGVYLPAGVRDPSRRYDDVATVLDAGRERGPDDEAQPERLAEHLARFRELHPYADDLVATLINPDRGDLFATAVQRYAARTRTDDDEAEVRAALPTFHVTAFVEDVRKSALPDLVSIRHLQIDDARAGSTDAFVPGLDATVRPVAQLDASPPPEAHLAVVADFTQPRVVALPSDDRDEQIATSSLSLYGLITRFVPRFIASGDDLRWQYRVLVGGRTEPHPSGPRYSETIAELHAALLRAGGFVIADVQGQQPALEVVLEAPRRRLLDALHARTDWVVTLDRFFGLDYYDSPSLPSLAEVARTYLIDYMPEFAEGLGHQLVVTTAWREEIEELLRQAIDELGFGAVDQSVGQLLHYLKTVSGRLALQVLQSSTGAAAAVGLGAVTAWLQRQGRLAGSILVPVDLHPRLFSPNGSGAPVAGERRCDLALISLRRNIVEATFIEVKWRRGLVDMHELAQDMVLQMQDSARAMEARFFNDGRVDGALQRAYLANVLRFYFERVRRYGTFDPQAEASFLDHLSRLEKTGLDFRPSYEGYIVSLNQQPQKPFTEGDATIAVLTAHDFARVLDVTAPSRLPTSPDITGPNAAQVGGTLASNLARDDGGVDVSGHEQDECRAAAERGNEADVTSAGIVDVAAMAPDEVPISSTNPGAASAATVEDAAGAPPPDSATGTPALDTSTNAAPDAGAVPVDAPTAQDGEVVVPLGKATTGGEPVAWKPSVRGSPHLFIVGIPGQGKSWTVLRILQELARRSVPSLVFDFHGQFADPSSVYARAAQPTILDAAQGLPFSPFECSADGDAADWRANCLAIAEIFGYVAGLGDMQRDAVYTAVRDAYRARGFGDGEKDGPRSYPTMDDVRSRIEARERMRQISNVSARCRPLLEMDLFRPTEGNNDLLTTIRRGAVIDVHGLYAETLQLAAGAFVLRKLYRDMFRWGQAERLRLVLVLDEAHRLARDITLPKIMKEGRKFGIAVIVASQGLADFHQDVLGNAGTKVVFRTNYPESRRIAGFIRARGGQDLVARIEGLPVGSAYVQTPEMTFGELVRMYPLDGGA